MGGHSAGEVASSLAAEVVRRCLFELNGPVPEILSIAFAAANNVGQLVLTHMSGRYEDEEILAEAARIFPNSRIAADFDHIVV